jgi:putative FmdB family regulatory protein
MPRYDHRCTVCNHEFEVSRRLGEVSDETCPACGKPAKRVFTPVGVVFKGSGFHNTDYRTPTKGESAEESPPTPPAPSCGASCTDCPVAGS